jgi:magnesium transporter
MPAEEAQTVLRIYAIEGGALRPVSGEGEPSVALLPEAAWVDLVRPTTEEERTLEAMLGIDVPTREEAGGLQSSDRLVARNGVLYLSALVPAGPGATPPTIPVTFVRTRGRLVTVRYSPVDALDPLIEHCRSGEATLADADELFAVLLETIIDRMADQLEKIGAALDRIKRAIFRHPAALARRAGGRRVPITRRMRRLETVIEDIGVEHELASDLRESLQSLIRLVAFARAHEAGEGLRRRLKVIDADLRTAAEHTAYLAADMEFMLDATVGLIGIQQNKVIYLLSIVSIALTPPVLVASVYGMNFEHMPELAWPYGYAWALGLMVVSAVGPFVFFKLRGWL